MKKQTLRNTHRLKTISEIMMLSGLLLIMGAAYLFWFVDSPLAAFILFTTGLVLLFIGYSNFAHMRENFKESLITEWLAETVSYGDYSPRSGLSKTQVIKSLFFNHEQTITTHDLVSGAMNNIAFISGDLQVYDQQDTVFNGWLFIFEFNTPFACHMVHVPTSLKHLKHPSMHTIDVTNGYQTFLSSPTCDHQTKAWLKTFNSLNQKNQDIWFSIHDSKCYLAFNHRHDPFTIKLFKPLNLHAIEQFKVTLTHIETFIKSFKS